MAIHDVDYWRDIVVMVHNEVVEYEMGKHDFAIAAIYTVLFLNSIILGTWSLKRR
jgi:hypothetical protein